MSKWTDRLEAIQLRVAALFLTLFIACIGLQVLSRYIPGVTVLWAGDIATYAFIWMVFLGAGVMVRRRQHFQLGVLKERLRGRLRLGLDMFTQLAILFFSIVITVYGIKLTLQFWDWSINALPAIKQRYVWSVLPVTGFTMVFYTIANLLEDIAKWKRGYA